MKSYITKSEVVAYKQKGFKEVTNELSREDISTIVEVYRKVLETHSPKEVQGLLKSTQGYFLFILDDSVEGEFDFFPFLNKYYKSDLDINCSNVEYIFPRGLSMGVYPDDERVESVSEEEEECTGFMDEQSLDPVPTSNRCFSLLHQRYNRLIPIPPQGIVLGRSARTADYVIEGNINVSRNHARVEIEGDHLKVTDLKASNGTFINGLRVQDTGILNLGDSLSLANENFIVK